MTTKNLLFYAAITIAVALLPLAAWNGAIVSAQSSQVSAAPPTIGEWSMFLGTAGGSMLSGLVALATWASKYLTGKPQSVATVWLPVLQTMLSVQQGKDVGQIVVTFTDGTSQSIHIADVKPVAVAQAAVGY